MFCTWANFGYVNLKSLVSCDSENETVLCNKGWTPIILVVLEKYLTNYSNQADAKLLLDGFSNGFHLQYTGPRMASEAKNLFSTDVTSWKH